MTDDGYLVVPGRRGPVEATVEVPGSKSVANRALVCALLAEGESRVSGLPAGDDVIAMVAALTGAGRGRTEGDSLVVAGGLSRGPLLTSPVACGLAGTTSRFLTAVAALCTDDVVIDGDLPLRGRPMGDLHAALSSLGATVTPEDGLGRLPVRVRGPLVGGRVRVSGESSSQFISALMLIGPVLADGLTIEVAGDLVSAPYVEMTATVMRDFSAEVLVEGSTIRVSSGGYRPCDYRVEPDFSSAAFPVAATLIAGGSVRLPGLGRARLQGDSRLLDLAAAMGAHVRHHGADITVTVDPDASLEPLEADLSDCSDLVPPLAVACAFADGTSSLTGIGFIRAKESDRIGDLATELSRAGASVVVQSDGLGITGPTRFGSVRFDTHHDHRMAMALALVALSGVDVGLSDADVVTKSWPGYFAAMADVLGETRRQN